MMDILFETINVDDAPVFWGKARDRDTDWDPIYKDLLDGKVLKIEIKDGKKVEATRMNCFGNLKVRRGLDIQTTFVEGYLYIQIRPESLPKPKPDKCPAGERPTFEQARELARGSDELVSKFSYRQKRPKGFPHNPDRMYAEWKGWNDFLGTDKTKRRR